MPAVILDYRYHGLLAQSCKSYKLRQAVLSSLPLYQQVPLYSIKSVLILTY